MEPVLEVATLLATLPAIVAVVNLLKRLFPNLGDWALGIAVVLGILFNVLDVAFVGNVYYEAASNGLLLGLAAAGLHDVAKTASTRVSISAPETASVLSADAVVVENPVVPKDTDL